MTGERGDRDRKVERGLIAAISSVLKCCGHCMLLSVMHLCTYIFTAII